MGVTRHSDPLAFLAAAAKVLSRDEGSASALTAWTQDLIDHPPPADDRLYLATYAAQDALGVAFQRRDGGVVIAHSDPVAAQAFASDLAGEWPQLQGVVGAPAACESFALTWRNATGREPRLRFHLRSHVLTAVIPAPSPPGAMRNARDSDIEWLIGAHIAFIADARLPDDPARVPARMPERIAEGRIRIWDDGGPVAFVGFAASGGEAARVAPVWTAPSFRRRGYASALVAALARELLERGRTRILLDTDLANPTSNAIYARIGFRPLDDYCHFDFVAP